MAQKVNVLFIDDLDGKEAEGTVRFGLDGTDYEIDLSTKNATKLRGIFGPYVEVARKTSTGARSAGRPKLAAVPTTRDRANRGRELANAREWLRGNGYADQVKDRGRVSDRLMTAYRSRTPNLPPVPAVPGV